MRRMMSFDIDKKFKVDFNSQNSNFETKLNKVSNTIETSINVQPSKEEVYYDEIIYYDGGGVDGWESEKNTLKP